MAIILDTSKKTIQVVLGGTITTNQLPVVASWSDITTPSSGGSLDTLTNGATAVTAVAAPSGGIKRQMVSLAVQNQDTVAATVTVQMYDGTNTRQLVVVALQTGEQLLYDVNGWTCLDINGNVKTNQPASSGASSTALSAASVANTLASSTASSALIAASTASSQALSAGGAASTASSAGSLGVLGSSQASSMAAIETTLSSAVSRVKSSFSW